MNSAQPAAAASLRDYIRVVRRRLPVVVLVAVLVPAAAIAFSLHQQTLYEAHAQVLLSSQNLAAQLTNTQSTGINLQPDRIAATQASVARVPTVAAGALAAAPGSGYTLDAFLARSSVSTSPNTDLLTFSAIHPDPQMARRLVDAYARQYTRYRHQLDTAAIQNGLRSVRTRIDALRGQGVSSSSPVLSSLIDRQATLATMAALQTSNATVVELAPDATRVQPKPTRNAILGVLLGLVLGVGIAFLWDALDTRVRTAQEAAEHLGGLPLLARIPASSRRFRAGKSLSMLDDRSGLQAETFRMLRTNLEFARLGRKAVSIVVTSAIEDEGKSTTAANLAVALARAGQRVALVDLDLRRPTLASLFDIESPGLTAVAVGRATLYDAVVGVDHGGEGRLLILPAGPIPPDPGEFVATEAVRDILAELREGADTVLIDAPPSLRVGDAMTLSSRADAVVVVTRLGEVRRQMLTDLARQLATVPTPVLGFVATGSTGGDVEYGYGVYQRQYGVSSVEEALR